MKKSLLPRKLAGLILLLCCTAASAEEIAIPLSGGNKALADYRLGMPDKPAVFILHGFLQTYRFSTVQLIADELADNGYTVLAPTLTLNIDQRRKGLGCDAIQNHSVADGNREIAEWLGWLQAQGHSRLIVIGHSSGSTRLLSYLAEGSGPQPQLFIATAIGPIDDWRHPQQAAQQQVVAMQRARSNRKQLHTYTLGFCNDNYTAPPEAYLSYRQWDERWILEQLQKLKVPLHVVMGSNDTWLPPGWSAKVAATQLPLTLVDEASHYFNGPSEFEFQELMVELVDGAETRKQ